MQELGQATICALLEEWITIGDRILDIQALIRLLHPKWNNTPIEKVMNHLIDAYKASGMVEQYVATGWIR